MNEQVALEAAGDLDVGDVEELVVRAARKPDPERLPDRAVGAVAAADVGGLDLGGVALRLDGGAHAGRVLRKAEEARFPLDAAARFLELAGEKALVVVLRIGERERVRAEAL